MSQLRLVAFAVAVAGIASCRSRSDAADAVRYVDRVRVVTFAEVIADLSALMNLVLVGCMIGMGLAIAVAFAVRSWAPLLARLSLGAVLGFATVFALAVGLKVSLPILAWAVVAMLGLGIVSVAVVLRRRLAASSTRVLPVRLPEVA